MTEKTKQQLFEMPLPINLSQTLKQWAYRMRIVKHRDVSAALNMAIENGVQQERARQLEANK